MRRPPAPLHCIARRSLRPSGLLPPGARRIALGGRLAGDGRDLRERRACDPPAPPQSHITITYPPCNQHGSGLHPLFGLRIPGASTSTTTDVGSRCGACGWGIIIAAGTSEGRRTGPFSTAGFRRGVVQLRDGRAVQGPSSGVDHAKGVEMRRGCRRISG